MSYRASGPARPPAGRPGLSVPRWPRHWARACTVAAAVIVAVVVAARAWTDHLWFASVRYSTVFDVTYGTQCSLFFAGGLVMAAAMGLNAGLAYRVRPGSGRALPSGSDGGARAVPNSEGGARALPALEGGQGLRAAIDARRRPLLAVVLLLAWAIAGAAMAVQWRTWLLFIDQVSFGRADPQFHMDLSFFVFTYPFIRLVLGYLFAAVLLSLATAGVVHGLYGGLARQGRRLRATRAAQAHLFLLMGVFVLLKAVAYWVDRYGIDFSHHGDVTTGASYTDVSAMLPAKTALAVIAVLCAALFFAGSVRGSATAPGVGFGLMVLSAVLVGGLYPLVIQQFVVAPNELARQSPYIWRQIHATRQAYGVAGVRVISYPGTGDGLSGSRAVRAAAQAGLPVMDPALTAQAFRQLQQDKGFYQFPQSLTVDRYRLPGASEPQDMLVAVRSVSAPPAGEGTWVNTHLVYTHGFGFVAARADAAQPDGSPSFTEDGIPPRGPLQQAPAVGWYQPRVYFGQQEGGYVIVGGPPGRPGQEFDYPAGGGQRDYTYTGNGGPRLGPLLNRLMYAVRFQQPDILFSGAVNSRSRILYDRQPLERVARVAPFLTLDANTYPVVADHRILWVVDGYTTTDDYPYSQRIDLSAATATSQAPDGSATGESAGQINYLRNSVKAVVDAYTGAVTLYQWGPADPLLRAWMKAFPGTIKPRSAIPGYLLPHLRYPPDEFEVQREILATYHVTAPQAFYGGQDFWSPSGDPARPSGGPLPGPPAYLTLSVPGYRRPEFSLTTTFTPRDRSDLAAFMAVDSNPGPGYGTIRILQLPQDSLVAGPALAHSAFQAYPAAVADASQLRRDGERVVLGGLITLPADGGILDVEPEYTSAGAGGGSYPELHRVFAYYDGRVGYAATLAGALAQMSPEPAGTAPGGGAAVRDYLNLAERYYALAETAFGRNDPSAAGKDLALMKQALDNARRAAQAAAPPARAAQARTRR